MTNTLGPLLQVLVERAVVGVVADDNVVFGSHDGSVAIHLFICCLLKRLDLLHVEGLLKKPSVFKT